MSNKFNLNEDSITIEAELPIPLGELAIYILKNEEKDSCLLDLLYNKPETVNLKVKNIIEKIISKKKLKVKINELQFGYNDSDKLSHGVAYFKVKLTGVINELKKIAGENRICFFEWNDNN